MQIKQKNKFFIVLIYILYYFAGALVSYISDNVFGQVEEKAVE